MDTKNNPIIALIAQSEPSYSQTFVSDHIKHLAARPIFLDDFETANGFLESATQKILRFLRGPFKMSDKHSVLLIDRIVASRCEVVLIEFVTTGLLCMDVCVEMNMPFVVHFHGFDIYRTDIVRKYGKRLKRLFAHAKFLIAVSEHMKERLLQLGAPEEKIVVNSCGVDIEKFSNSEIRDDSIEFVAVGRFVEKKSPLDTLRAFALVRQAVPDARLSMVGEGEMLPKAERSAKSLGLSESVRFLGEMKHEEVVTVLNRARAFVQHSVVASNGDTEGTPVVILEAMASGLPVVSTRHAGIMDVVIEHETGFLVDEHDVAGMSEAMVLLAQDRDLAGRMGMSGRSRVEETYDMNIRIGVLREILTRAARMY